MSDFLGYRFAGSLRECCVVGRVLGGIGGGLLSVVTVVRSLFLLCFVLWPLAVLAGAVACAFVTIRCVGRVVGLWVRSCVVCFV